MTDWIDKILNELEHPGISEQFRDALFYQMGRCALTEEEEEYFCELILSEDITDKKAKELLGRFKLNERSFHEISNPSNGDIRNHIRLICGLD